MAYGPQVITKRGEDAVVVMGKEEYDRITRPETSLTDFLRRSPLAGSELDLSRDSDPGRNEEL